MLLYDLSFVMLGSISLLVTFFITRGFYKNRVNAYYFIIPVFIVFYVLPTFLDYLFGVNFTGPMYSITIYRAMENQLTTTIYNLYILLILLIFYYSSRSKLASSYAISDIEISKFFDFLHRWRWLTYIIIISPIMLALLSNNYSFYMSYVDRARQEATTAQMYAVKMVALSIPLLALMISEKIYRFKKNSNVIYLIGILLLFLILTSNFYIHGKRSIVASFIFLLMTSLILTRVASKKIIFFLGAGITILFYLFLQMYGKNIEGAQSFFETYQGLRVDFSRDYNLKFVIFHELLNENYVLPYKGASYLFLLTFYIPRELWPDKPVPYAVYFTNSAFGDFGGDYFYGWGLTTSFVSEAVSNLGVVGLVIFPLFYIWGVKKIERLGSPLLKILGYLIMSLLLIIHPMAIMTLIMLFFALIFLSKYKFKV